MKNKTMIKDLSVLKNIFNQDDDKSILANALIDELVFMNDTINRLKTEINNNDVIQEMPQGSYSINRVNPVLKSYNTTIKNYQSLLKNLNEMIPGEIKANNDGEYSYIEYLDYKINKEDTISNNLKNKIPMSNDDKKIMSYDEWVKHQKMIENKFFM